VGMGGVVSEWFDVRGELWQGCVCSIAPLLFNIYMDLVVCLAMAQSNAGGVRGEVAYHANL
jgi:hypothetical protein